MGAVPVPVRPTICGLVARVSATLRAAERVNGSVGENLTEIVQVPFTAMGPPQVVVSEKSPGLVPVMLTPLMVKLAVPLLVTVILVAELVVPTFWLEKVTLAGLKFICPAVPVPLNPTDCGLAGPLSARDIAADSAATREGVNVTEIVQLPPAETELPQVLALRAKSMAFVPVRVTPVKFKVALPVFVSVTDWAALVVL